MNPEPNHDEIKELLAAYALGAVPDDEAATIRSHIMGCEECMEEADRLAVTADRLVLVAGSEELPAGFADRVMASALGTEEEVAAKPRRRWSLVAVGAVVASLAVAAVMTFQVIELREERERKEQVLAVLSRDSGLDLAGSPGVEAAVVPNGVGSLFAASGLEPAPSGRTYQLWLMDGDTPVSAGTFSVNDGVALFEVAQPIEDYDGAAITIEDAGGADAPTQDPILSS